MLQLLRLAAAKGAKAQAEQMQRKALGGFGCGFWIVFKCFKGFGLVFEVVFEQFRIVLEWFGMVCGGVLGGFLMVLGRFLDGF